MITRRVPKRRRDVCRKIALTRVTMNVFEFREYCENDDDDDDVVAITKRKRRSRFDDTSVLMRLISVVMQDVQQRNLNAKHSATAAGSASDKAKFSDASESLYIGLNRSCSQRKTIEVCCAVKMDLVEEFIDTMQRSSISFRTLFESFQRTIVVYFVAERGDLVDALSRLSELPRLVFVSCKNLTYRCNGGCKLANSNSFDSSGSEASVVDSTGSNDHYFAYLANFILYHAFHESDRSFDERRFGARFRYTKTLLFVLATVNAELLRVSSSRAASSTKSENLALNIQSLGKAYDDVGLHVFAENSIQQMRKALKDSDSANTRSYATEGLLVDRYLGRVSRVGINAVEASVTLTL